MTPTTIIDYYDDHYAFNNYEADKHRDVDYHQ